MTLRVLRTYRRCNSCKAVQVICSWNGGEMVLANVRKHYHCSPHKRGTRFFSQFRGSVLLATACLRLILPSDCIFGQVFSAGVKGGLPINHAFDAQTASTRPPPFGYLQSPYQSAVERTVPYTVGPTLEVRLPARFQLEADALYSRAIYDYTAILTLSPSRGSKLIDEKHVVGLWGFPILLKYRPIKRSDVRPFLAGGATIEYNRDTAAQGLTGVAAPAGMPCVSPIHSFTQTSTVVGPTIAAGLEFGLWRLRVSSEIRYTRWAGEAIAISPVLRSNQNSTQFLIGVISGPLR